MRGIAALCVAFDHLTYSVFQPVRDSVYHWFDPGQYGVFVFFLVSGYIMPASLERRCSVRGLLACCVSGCRFIEAPMQRLGRRVAGRLDARFGPDRPPPRRPRPDPAAAGLADQADGRGYPRLTPSILYTPQFFFVVPAFAPHPVMPIRCGRQR